MNIKLLKTIILPAVFSLFILASGCKKDENKDNIVTMKIASNTVKASVPFGSQDYKADFLFAQEGKNGVWGPLYTSIEGFNYEKGYNYELKVKQVNIENPLQDAPSIKYILVKEVSKTRDNNVKL